MTPIFHPELADALEVKDAAMQVLNSAEALGRNSAAYQQAKEALRGANNVVAYLAEKVRNARNAWNAARNCGR